MKITALYSGFFLLSLLFMGCEKETFHIVPSDQISTRSHDITSFNELYISDPFQVYVQFSDTEQELKIEANDNLHQIIEIEQVDGRLSIKLEDNINLGDNTPVLKVFLTASAFQRIKAQGATQVYLQNQWFGDQTEIILSGASYLEGTVTAEQLTAKINGASTLALRGSATLSETELEGTSEMTGLEFATSKLKATLSGGCNLTLTVHEELHITASGGSKVQYQGEGIVTYQKLSDSSEIIKL